MVHIRQYRLVLIRSSPNILRDTCSSKVKILGNKVDLQEWHQQSTLSEMKTNSVLIFLLGLWRDNWFKLSSGGCVNLTALVKISTTLGHHEWHWWVRRWFPTFNLSCLDDTSETSTACILSSFLGGNKNIPRIFNRKTRTNWDNE